MVTSSPSGAATGVEGGRGRRRRSSSQAGAHPVGAGVLALAVGGALLTATIGAALAWQGRVEDDEQDAFDTESAAVERAVVDQLDEVDVLLAATAESIGTVADLDVDEFSDAVVDATSADLPSAVTSVVVVQPVDDEGIAPLVSSLRDAGLVDFQVRNPVDGHQEHLVATYEQSGSAQPALDGLDLASVPPAEAALDEARADARPVTSDVLGALPFADDSLLRSGFLVVLPATSAGAGSGGAASVEHWTVALVDGEALLAAALDEVPDAELDVELRRGEDLLATTSREGGSSTALSSAPPDARVERTLSGGDQPIELVVADLDGVDDGRAGSEAMVILLVGGLASVLMGALVWALARGRAGALAAADLATQTLVASEEQFRTVVQNLSDVVLVIDEDGTIRYASPSVKELLGWTPEQLVGRSVFESLDRSDGDRVRRTLATPGGSGLLEFRLRDAEGELRAFEGTVSGLVEEAGLGGFVVTAHDVSHRVATEERLAHDATHDPLTRLPNRSLLHDRLSHALDRSARTGADVAVLFIDLDGFKEVNDSAGHAAGDRVLTEVAGRIAATARASDTVARVGGDEFVVVCEEAGSLEGAISLADRVLQALRPPVVQDGIQHLVGASVGIALASRGERDAAGLLRRADGAMYRAKAAGRGRVEVDAAPVAVPGG